MKKSITCIMVFVMALSFFSFTSAEAGSNTVLKLSHQLPAKHSVHISCEKFAELVNAKTDGNVEVKIFPSASLGSERENAEALKTGTLDMAVIAVEFYPAYVEESGLLVLPYIYNSYDHAFNVLQGNVGKEVSKLIEEKTTIKVLTYLVQPFRQMYTVGKELNTVEDLKGLKMRVPESPIYVDTFKQLGAAPTPVPFGEVYTALETGVVQGVENAPETIYTASLHEVTKVMNITNHLEGPTTISMSAKAFGKLSDDYKKAILEAADEVAEFQLNATATKDQYYRDKCAETLKVVTPDVTSFRNSIDYTLFACMKSEKARELFKQISE